MYFAYVDETGIDGRSPVIVMAGIVADALRLNRTRQELNKLLSEVDAGLAKNLKELKSSELFPGKGVWNGVPGNKRLEVVTRLCQWVVDRKHSLALSAIDHEQFKMNRPEPQELSAPWIASAFHIALQLQRCHQSKEGNKGSTVLIFDDNKKGISQMADLVVEPPAWSDDYYSRDPKKPRLHCLIDTPFAVQSHHVGLVQVADVLAAIFRRHTELTFYGQRESYQGELTNYQSWVDTLTPKLLGIAHRWPTSSRAASAQWYREVAPESLLKLR